MVLTIVTYIIGIVAVVVYLLLLSPIFDDQVIRLMDKAFDRFFNWVLKTTEDKKARNGSNKGGK